MSDPTKEDIRVRNFKGWGALRDACRKQHPKGPGGAAICVCGVACGGSEACSMLATIRHLLANLPTENLPKEWKDHVDMLASCCF